MSSSNAWTLAAFSLPMVGGGLPGNAVLRDKSLNDLDNFLLLPTWKLRDGIEDLASLAAGRGSAPRLRLAEQFLDGDAERLRHGQQNVRAWRLSGAFPKQDVRMGHAHLPGQLANGQLGCLSQDGQSMLFRVHANKINGA